MTLELCTVGGYSEVGKNMTAIKYNDEVVICDMGFFIPAIVSYEEMEGGPRTLEGLKRRGAIPSDFVIKPWADKVKAIAISHCHLDHMGAIGYLAQKYKCPVYGTPFTIEFIKKTLHDEKLKIPNKLQVLNAGSKIKVSENIELEFINVTHSTPQAVFIAVHTPDGTVIYTNDFKFDNSPVLGKKPDYERMEKIAKEKDVVAMVVDSLYADSEGKTSSEKVAKEMLKDVMTGTNNKDNLIIVTTFASHIARLKSIIELGKKLRRKVVFFGRSLAKYTSAAENINLVNFSKDVEIMTYSRQVQNKLKQIEKKGRNKYLIVCTGNQAEPGAILTRLAYDKLKFKFNPEDQVIFSCKTIPVTPNIEAREKLEKRLKQKKVRIFKEIHVSGHAKEEDLRDLINIFKPKMIIPSHAPPEKLQHAIDLAKEMGYVKGKNVFMPHDGEKFLIVK